jgi:hypothetical protein
VLDAASKVLLRVGLVFNSGFQIDNTNKELPKQWRVCSLTGISFAATAALTVNSKCAIWGRTAGMPSAARGATFEL